MIILKHIYYTSSQNFVNIFIQKKHRKKYGAITSDCGLDNCKYHIAGIQNAKSSCAGG